jgi:hypothetical protein
MIRVEASGGGALYLDEPPPIRRVAGDAGE